MPLNILNIITAIINNMAAKIIKCGVNNVKENKSLKTTAPNINIQINVTNKTLLKLLNGTLILYKSIKPVNPVNKTASVDTSSSVNLMISGKTVIIRILATIVRAVGKDFLSTLIIILPFIRSLFGSNAKMNDGIPIVTILVNVNWIGINGYALSKNKKITANKVA